MTSILIGSGKTFSSRPENEWREELAEALATPSSRLDFMSPEHHEVRDTVVKEVAYRGTPLSPEYIAERTEIALPRIRELLDELEKRLFFLVRNDEGEVVWAFPVTAEPTAHRLAFDTGEHVFAA